MLPVHLRLMAALVETIGAPIKLTVAAAAAHDTGFREKVILLAQVCTLSDALSDALSGVLSDALSGVLSGVSRALTLAPGHNIKATSCLCVPHSSPDRLPGLLPAFHRMNVRVQRRLDAQAFHRMNVRLHRRLDTRQHARQHRHLPIRPLNEERAVDLAAHLLGELFVFGMGGSIIVAEVAKQGRAEARKEEAHRREVQEATTRHRYLQQEMFVARERLMQAQHSLGVDDTALPPLPPLPHSLTHTRGKHRHLGSGVGGLEEEEKGREEGEDGWREEEEGVDEEEEHAGRMGGGEGQEGLDAVREREMERTVERQEEEERREEEAREEEEKRRMGFFMPRVLSADFGFGPPM
ncbi:unnamed protein product [Closterium sp. NIES-64]|nr:unnamed protein product [Closterium sp. NIES-64]